MVGPPGAGKGTQAKLLAAHYRISHLASGELLRREVAAGTETGRTVAGYLERGDLAPEEVVLELLLPAIVGAARAGGYVLDGFPRTVRQARAVHALARATGGVALQAVVHLRVSAPELRRRMLDRGSTAGRTDDTAEVIEHRLGLFHTETDAMLHFYEHRGLLLDVDGEQPVDAVFEEIVGSVDALVSRRSGEAGS